MIKKSDCGQDTAKVFTKFLSGASGKMKATHLSRMFKNEYGLDVKFDGPVEILELKDFITEDLGLGDTVITGITSLYGKASLNLSGKETISVSCAKCSEPGERNIKLKIDQETIWLSSNIKVKRSGFKLLRDVSPFGQDLSPALVKASSALDDGKSPIFRDIENLKFYRPNKPLSKGKTLKQTDLSPKLLVKFNQSVEVLLKGKNISLKTKATARQNGKHGETVKLYNQKTKKNILGTVIDFNTVMVEL